MKVCGHTGSPHCPYCDLDAPEDARLQAARDAVIEASRQLHNSCRDMDLRNLRDALHELNKLETPPDPLGPVREFVRYCMSSDCLFSDRGYAKLKAAAKALGVEAGK